MGRDAAKLLQDALRLPPEALAALVGSLIESLDETVDEDTEAAWEDEILRRVRDLDAGRVRTISWVEARRRITEG